MSIQMKTRGRPRSAIPAYRLHKRSGQAVVTVASRDIYLGRHGSEESRRRYGEIIAQVAAGRPLASAPSSSDDPQTLRCPTVDQLTVVFLDFAAGHYRKNGKPTSEMDILKSAIAPLHEHYGDVPAESFGPKLLKQYRDKLIARGLTRNTVNSFF